MKKQIKKFVVLALAVGMLVTSVLGTSAAFDPAYYAAQNPDVVKALGNSPAMLKLHYDMFGRKEARMSNKNDVEAQLRRLFNEKEYAKLYPDVEKAFGGNKELMFNHYIAFGLLEGRRPSEKVSKAAAASLKKTVEKAMKDAGLAATPGSPEVVAAITGKKGLRAVKGSDDIIRVTIPTVEIPKHNNAASSAVASYWVGIGIPDVSTNDAGGVVVGGYQYAWGLAASEDAAVSAVKAVSSYGVTLNENDDIWTPDGSSQKYAMFYWGSDSDWKGCNATAGQSKPADKGKAWGYLAVKKKDDDVVRYVIDFTRVSFKIVGSTEISSS